MWIRSMIAVLALGVAGAAQAQDSKLEYDALYEVKSVELLRAYSVELTAVESGKDAYGELMLLEYTISKYDLDADAQDLSNLAVEIPDCDGEYVGPPVLDEPDEVITPIKDKTPREVINKPKLPGGGLCDDREVLDECSGGGGRPIKHRETFDNYGFADLEKLDLTESDAKHLNDGGKLYLDVEVSAERFKLERTKVGAKAGQLTETGYIPGPACR